MANREVHFMENQKTHKKHNENIHKMTNEMNFVRDILEPSCNSFEWVVFTIVFVSGIILFILDFSDFIYMFLGFVLLRMKYLERKLKRKE